MEEEPPLHQPQQQPMPPPEIQRADQYVDKSLGNIVLQNEYVISAMKHQFKVNAHFNEYQSGLADDINAMAARLNIGERVRRLVALLEFQKKASSNPFDEPWDSNEEEED